MNQQSRSTYLQEANWVTISTFLWPDISSVHCSTVYLSCPVIQRGINSLIIISASFSTSQLNLKPYKCFLIRQQVQRCLPANGSSCGQEWKEGLEQDGEAPKIWDGPTEILCNDFSIFPTRNNNEKLFNERLPLNIFLLFKFPPTSSQRPSCLPRARLVDFRQPILKRVKVFFKSL